MTHRIGHITVIQEEPEDICTDCGKKDELRPYGPNFARVCFDCAMKDPIGTEIRMHKKMFGDDITEEQATEYVNDKRRKQ